MHTCPVNAARSACVSAPRTDRRYETQCGSASRVKPSSQFLRRMLHQHVPAAALSEKHTACTFDGIWVLVPNIFGPGPAVPFLCKKIFYARRSQQERRTGPKSNEQAGTRTEIPEAENEQRKKPTAEPSEPTARL